MYNISVEVLKQFLDAVSLVAGVCVFAVLFALVSPEKARAVSKHIPGKLGVMLSELIPHSPPPLEKISLDEIKPPKKEKKEKQKLSLEHYAFIWQRLTPPSPTKKTAEQKAIERKERIIKQAKSELSQLVEIVAIFLNEKNPNKSFAIVQRGANQKVVRVGDEIQLLSRKTVINEIRRGEIEFEYGGASVTLKLERPEGSPFKPAIEKKETSSVAVKKLGANKWRISRELLTEENLRELAHIVKLKPYLEARRFIGYRVENVEKGTLPDNVGVKKGDVIIRLNNLTLTTLSPTQLSMELKKLLHARTFTVDLRRGVVMIRFFFEVSDGTTGD